MLEKIAVNAIEYLMGWMQSAALKIVALLMLLPIMLAVTTFFDGRFPAWLIWLLMLVSNGKPSIGVNEFLQVILLIVLAIWLLEVIGRFLLNYYFHKGMIIDYARKIRTWFWILTFVYLGGLIAIPFAQISPNASLGFMFGIVIFFYLIALGFLGFAWVLEQRIKLVKSLR